MQTTEARSGLPASYYRARYYDPASARFFSEDPIAFQGGIDFYAYVDNNPINLTDPFGLCDKPNNPCQFRGRALSPWDYASAGKAASHSLTTLVLDALKGWPKGRYLDAQPLASGTVQQRAAYGNYAYGVYMKAAGLTLSQALSGANAYAALRSKYPAGTQMDHNYPSLPAANVANITKGYNDEQNGTLCE